MADNSVEFELADACLAHTVGNAVAQADQRGSMLERRRPIMQVWANFLSGDAQPAKVIPMARGRGPKGHWPFLFRSCLRDRVAQNDGPARQFPVIHVEERAGGATLRRQDRHRKPSNRRPRRPPSRPWRRS